jgi:hypothetical protein
MSAESGEHFRFETNSKHQVRRHCDNKVNVEYLLSGLLALKVCAVSERQLKEGCEKR